MNNENNENATMNNENAPMNNENAPMNKMTLEEEATMLTEISRRFCDLTTEYVETVHKMFQTYPELRRGFGIVVAMNMFDHNAVRCIQCNSSMRDRLVVELQSL